MTEPTAAVPTSPLRDLVVRRQLAAPVAAVWRAFTEDAEVMKWWGPEHFTAPVARMDVREGGYGPGPFYDLSKAGLEQYLDKLQRFLATQE